MYYLRSFNSFIPDYLNTLRYTIHIAKQHLGRKIDGWRIELNSLTNYWQIFEDAIQQKHFVDFSETFGLYYISPTVWPRAVDGRNTCINIPVASAQVPGGERWSSHWRPESQEWRGSQLISLDTLTMTVRIYSRLPRFTFLLTCVEELLPQKEMVLGQKGGLGVPTRPCTAPSGPLIIN